MNKQLSVLIGGLLILMGLMASVLTLGLPLFGIHVGHGWGLGQVWRLWPLLVIGVGLLFGLPPWLARRQPAWGILFIPAMPILATGAILLFASVFNAWGVWSWLWPQEVLAVAAGFMLAALYARSVWPLIPAILIGLNGVVLQFCALTGWWNSWSVLWSIEPLAIGLCILLVGAKQRSNPLVVTGLGVCGLAVLCAVGMISIVGGGWWPLRLAGPAVLILLGGLLLLWGIVRSPTSSSAVARMQEG